jgi:predicted ABC-type ATPase
MGRSFIAETVFSHLSKLKLIDTAQAAGYFVALHVLLLP